MRIVFVINSLIYGGAETQLIALSRELARRGHRVVIYTLRRENPRAAELAGSGVRIVADRRLWKLDPGLIRRIRTLIHEFQPDIVHGFLLEGNLYATLAAAGTGVPALNSERGADYQWPLLHRLSRFVTRCLVTGLVANSYAGARFTQRLLRLPDSRVHVVWNGINLRRIEESRRAQACDPRSEFFGSADVKVACLVGMIRPEKDYLLALRVAEALARRDAAWRVLFIGDCLPQTSEYKEEVLRAHRTMRARNLAAFAGLRRDVAGLVSACNVLFSTSVREGFPNVVLEAMAVGTPVVSTDYSDIRLILPNEWQIVDGRDPDDLAEAIVRADRERESVATRQREWLQANATIATAVDRLEAVYRQYCRPETGIAAGVSAAAGPTC